MDYKERLEEAYDRLNYHRDTMREAMDAFTYFLTDLLWPCGEHGCLIGSEDYCDDIYYLYAEPRPNEFHRVTAIRNKGGRLEVCLDLSDGGDYSDYKVDENGWMDFNLAHITDLDFLADEVINNLEYSDGYQPQMKRYAVPFLRSQWTELTVEADNPDDAINKAEQIFREGKDGFVEWEDVDRPEYDKVTGVSEA